ncbi:hypothetical protein OX88_21575 [Pseudomonas coronafaciens pv. porri]|uniref:hypothetical protein n=1 Tax=Pseudomonas coronafaciens TaxID=53409 RepID=UPI0006ABDA45|nr:hypothetical protein [Pseudomonas coronafaciens]KOP53080.1 hypothetical protein OX88_21575 [Pseudomonas coronafaciens pv. porri]
MIYEQTIILKDDDSDSFPDALQLALEELKTLATSCPTLNTLSVTETGFKAVFTLDGKGSKAMCLHVAGLAAVVAGLGEVTGIRYMVVPRQNTACFELIF